MSRRNPGFGLVVFDPAVSTDTLTATGVGTRDSVYTEASPVPGRAVLESGSTVRPQLGQAQSVDLTLRTVKGGYPGRDGAAVLYRLGSDTTAADWRSWQDPVLVTGWSAPSDGWGAGGVYDAFAATVIPETGLVIVVAVDQSTGDAQTWSWDPRTGTWTTLYDWDAGAADGLTLPIGLAYDADRGALLLWSGYGDGGVRQQVAYQSMDGGTTWTIYSRAFAAGDSIDFSVTGSFYPIVGDDLDWLMIANEDLSDLGETAGLQDAANGLQLASSDRGVTWDQVTGSLTRNGNGQPLKGPAGFCYVYIEVADGSLWLRAKVIASARASLSAATAVTIDIARDYSACWACADDDGTIYVVARGAAGGATIGQLYAFRSTDGGVTWVQEDGDSTEYGWGVFDSQSASRYFDPKIAVASQGRVHLIGTSQGSGAPNTVQVVSLGGWSQVAHGSGTTNQIRTPKHRFGYGTVDSNASANAWTVGYLPISAPGNVGWTALVSTGTASLAGAQIGLALVTTAGQAQTYRYVASGKNASYMAVEGIVRIASSGSATLATIGTTGAGVELVPILEKSATYRYAAFIDIGSDGIQLRDGTTIRQSVSLDMTSQRTRIRVHLTKGTATCWYSRDGGVVWVRWADNETITSGTGTQDDSILFGNGILAVGHSFWSFVGAAAGADWQYTTDGINAITDTPAGGPVGHNFGRPIPGRGTTYPIPEGTASGASLARLHASGGPTHVGEVVEMPTGHDYPVEALDPFLFASPRRPWRSTSAGATALVWDQGADQETWYGGALALLVSNAIGRQWVLKRDDGSTGWTTLGTLDLAVGTGLKWTRIGRTITPASGTTAIARYLREGELVGGTIDLDGDCRTITANSAGFWSDATLQQVRLTLGGITGSEASSGTAGVLCASSGLLIVYPAADTPRRYLTVTCAGSQPTPDGYYQAGVVAIGRVIGLGMPAGFGWSSAQKLSRRSATAADGVTSITELGPPRRIVSYDWPDGCLISYLRATSLTPDYLAASGGAPIGSWQDVPVRLQEIMERWLASGEHPAVIVPQLPAADSTLLDPASWVYGRVTNELTVTSLVGTEGVSEQLAGPGLVLEELR